MYIINLLFNFITHLHKTDYKLSINRHSLNSLNFPNMTPPQKKSKAQKYTVTIETYSKDHINIKLANGVTVIHIVTEN